MNEAVTIPVDFEGRHYEFDAILVTVGYLHKLIVQVEGVELTFEMDEERNYRVLDTSEDQKAVHKVKPGLLQAIAEKLQSLHQ